MSHFQSFMYKFNVASTGPRFPGDHMHQAGGPLTPDGSTMRQGTQEGMMAMFPHFRQQRPEQPGMTGPPGSQQMQQGERPFACPSSQGQGQLLGHVKSISKSYLPALNLNVTSLLTRGGICCKLQFEFDKILSEVVT